MRKLRLNDRRLAFCQSVPERRMAKALLELPGFEFIWTGKTQLVAVHRGWSIGLASQVPFGPYHADFTLMSLAKSENQQWWAVVVEVDGHYFHERTECQAVRDRRRDRYLTANGVTVLRFTESEVKEDPEGCALEAMKLATDIQQKNLDRCFSAFLRKQAREASLGRYPSLGKPFHVPVHSDGGIVNP